MSALEALQAELDATKALLAKAKQGQDKPLTFDPAPVVKQDAKGRDYTVFAFKGGTGRDFNVGLAKLAAHASAYAEIVKIPGVIDHMNRIKAAAR
jgi:hypothetical protein